MGILVREMRLGWRTNMAVDKVVAVNLGGTNLRVGLVKGKKVLKYIKVSTPKTKQGLLKAMINSISKVIEKDVKGIGIASPGPLKNGVIKNPLNIPLRNFNLKKYLEKKFKKKVIIENDAASVALAEAKYGCKKKNFIILTLGTGVGGGIIINRELYHGTGYAGEVGYSIIDKGKILEYWWKQHRKVGKITELIKSRDKKAKKTLEEVTKHLGQGIASLIHILDPEIVILMGGAKEAGNKFLNLIKKSAYQYNLLPKKTPIKWSKLKYPGLLGASLLVR